MFQMNCMHPEGVRVPKASRVCSKHLHRIDCMLQDPSLSCIILKNPDTNRLIVTSMVPYLHSIHASLRDPNEAKIMWSGDFPPIPPVHVHREQREGTRAVRCRVPLKKTEPQPTTAWSSHSHYLYDLALVSDEKISTPVVT